jgi:chromosome segregation ATPase
MQSLRNELQQLSAQNESKTASTEELNISLQASRAQVESLESSNQALANELKQSQHSLSAAAETHQSQLNAAEAQYQAALSECQANHEAELNNRQIEWADESSMSAEQMRTFFQNQIEEYQRACQAKESELIDVYERKLESAKLSTQNHSDAFTQALNEVDRVEQQWRDECDRIKHEATLQSNQFQDQLRQVERADALIRETMNREREQMQTQLQQKDQRIAELEVVVANVNSDQSDQRQSTINLTAKLRVHRANAQVLDSSYQFSIIYFGLMLD